MVAQTSTWMQDETTALAVFVTRVDEYCQHAWHLTMDEMARLHKIDWRDYWAKGYGPAAAIVHVHKTLAPSPHIEMLHSVLRTLREQA